MADFIFLAIVVLVVAGGVALSWFFVRREIKSLREGKEPDMALGLIKQDIEAMKKRFEDGISLTQKEIQQSFEKTSDSYARMQRELGVLQEIGGQMKSVQEFLQSPKLRGNLGEQILKDLLEQILPKNHFHWQYKFRGGEIVDAVLKTNQGIVPVDSKFPMENFRKMVRELGGNKDEAIRDFKRDIKKHIDDVAKKYILPEEGTVDFAVLYVPSEAVYYEIIVNQPEVLDYGYQKKVYFVSPNTFYYFLKIVMVGLEGAKIEEASKRILAALKAIQRESVKLGEELRVLASHISNAKGACERANIKYERLVGRIEIAGELEEAKKTESS